jgi:DtxR family Mn-dependent transcriptional regulator
LAWFFTVVSLTVENYLKGILLLEPGESHSVSTGRIAAALGVAPGTVTAMLKTLEEAGLVRYRRYGGVQLTKQGETLALHVQRRHRVVELFLVKVLGMPWTEVHEEAEALEHAISEKVLRKMDALLGHPTSDPHGDPIPQANGQVPDEPALALGGARPGERLRVVRLTDQRPEFLKLAERLGLEPRAEVEVLKRDEAAQILRLSVARSVAARSVAARSVAARRGGRQTGAAGRQVVVAIAAAHHIMVQSAGPAGGSSSGRSRPSPAPARRGARRGRR